MSLWKNRDLGTALTVLVGLVVAIDLCLGVTRLNNSQQGRGMVIAGVALPGLALPALTKGV